MKIKQKQVEKKRELVEDFPNGWSICKLGDVMHLKNGYAFKSQDYSLEGIPLVRISDINDGKVIIEKAALIPERKANFDFIVEPGDLLIAMSGATTGKTGVYYGTQPCLQNQRVGNFKIISEDIVDKKYRNYYVTSLRKEIEKAAYGGAQPNISGKGIEAFDFPLAPLNEQKRIVEEIEKQFSRMDEAVESLKRVKANLNRYKTSLLKTAMTGNLTEDWRRKNPNIESAENLIKRISKKRYEKSKKRKKKSKKHIEISFSHHPKINSWVNVQLDQLIYIAGRIGWRGLKADEYTDEGPLFISVHALNYGEEVKYEEANHLSEERYAESPEIMLSENDILLCKDGAGIGKIGIVKNLPGKATVNSSLLVIRAQEAFIPKFLFYFLSGPDLQSIVQERITGSATPHLFQRDIKQFILSVPPLAEQREIVNRIESHLSVVEGIGYQVDTELKRADRFRQSILKTAFSGKLISQNPKDEPASFFLKRIKEERLKMEESFKEERRKGRKIMKPKKIAQKKRSVIEVLREVNRPIKPEELFQMAGYNSEEVEDFYQDLKIADHSNAISQKKRKNGDVFLRAV